MRTTFRAPVAFAKMMAARAGACSATRTETETIARREAARQTRQSAPYALIASLALAMALIGILPFRRGIDYHQM